MEVGEREARAIATLTNYATPQNIEAILSKTDDPDVVKQHFAQATPMIVGGFAIKCASAARLYQLLKGYGNGAMAQVAKILEVSERTAQRLVQSWDECIKPIIERDGDNAVFILEEARWYATAIEAAPLVQKLPAQLIDEATELKTHNTKATPGMWRKELGLSGQDEGSTTSEGGKLWRLLKKLATWDDSAIADAVDGADPRKVLNDTRDALVAVQSALNLLEERAKGRVE